MMPDHGAKALAIRNRIGVDAKAPLDAFEMMCDSLEAGEPLPPPLASFLASALRRTVKARSADRAPTLMFELGLIAPAKIGAPRLSSPEFERDLIKLRHWPGRNLTHGEIVRALDKFGDVKEGAIRIRLRKIDKRRKKVALLLNSPAAEQGRSLITKAIARRKPCNRKFVSDQETVSLVDSLPSISLNAFVRSVSNLLDIQSIHSQLACLSRTFDK